MSIHLRQLDKACYNVISVEGSAYGAVVRATDGIWAYSAVGTRWLWCCLLTDIQIAINKILDLLNTQLENRIWIEYGSIRNTSEKGWIPGVWINGRFEGSCYYEQGLDRNEALAEAWAVAMMEERRWIGDYKVAITLRSDQKSKAR